MAIIKCIGPEPIQSDTPTPIMAKATFGPEMTALKVINIQGCDGFFIPLNPGETIHFNCKCPGLPHLRRILENAHLEVKLTAGEKRRLAKLGGRIA